jgi:hypothetical protein
MVGLALCEAESQPQHAIPLFEQALAIDRRHGAGGEQLAMTSLGYAKALWAVGRKDEARRALAAARDEVHATPTSGTAREIAAWGAAHR